MNPIIEQVIIATPEPLMPFFQSKTVTRVTITPVGEGKFNIVAPANMRSPGLLLQNGGRIPLIAPLGNDVRPIVYYFAGSGTQGFRIMQGQTVVYEGILKII